MNSETKIRRQSDLEALKYLVGCIEHGAPIRAKQGSHRYIIQAKRLSRYLFKKKLDQYKDHIKTIEECIELELKIKKKQEIIDNA